MNIMQIMSLMGQGGGRMARAAGPLAAPAMKGGPLSIGSGTQANGIPVPIQRIDPDSVFDGMPPAAPAPAPPAPAMGSPAMPAPAMAQPGPSDMERSAVAKMPLLGPLSGISIDVPAPAPAERKGVFGRIGDFIGSDEGKGALLRASAQLLGGGSVGDAIGAGAQFVDGRRKERMDQQVREREFGQRDRALNIQQQGTDQTGLYQAGQLQNAATRANIDMAQVELGAKQQAERLKLDWARLSQADQQFLMKQAMEKLLEDGRNARHSTPSGSTVYASDSATARTGMTIDAADRRAGADNLGEIITTTGEVKPGEAGWFTPPTPGKPATKTSMKVRALPSSKEGLVPGAVYATAEGNARWNGAAFEAIE